jgi:xanthine dehydrogenase accessory factor
MEGPQTGCGHAALHDERWTWGSDGAADVTPDATGAATVHLRLNPPPRVLLLGAGPETPHLHAFMQQLGWIVRIVEHRARWRAFARAAGDADIIELAPDAAADAWRAQPIDAAIAMSHNYLLDRKNLAYCADRPMSYVGLLGPPARRDALLDDLGTDIAARLRARLHAPVGLPLGGTGPEVLALSIVAELQQHFTQRQHDR